ncbi:MAG TPA: hypothetical protein VMS43_01180 [Allosphingosinicella sp.]|nr:hypothetical protein [Allosphingosinicella sp.]
MRAAGRLRTVARRALPAALLFASLVPGGAAEARSLAGCEGDAPATRSPGITMRLVAFDHSPFPYDGVVPATGEAFLNVTDAGRRGRASRRGRFWEDETYSDRRVLLAVPDSFDPARPAVIIVFFHGNNATLARDVIDRQAIPAQLAQSGLNAVLVAPQFAVDALDSSAGRFWEAGFFRAFLVEAGERVARCLDDDGLAERFHRTPVILAAYSGGYNPAAAALRFGGANERIAGVALFDALYGETETFADWIRRGGGFFVSAFSRSTRSMNAALASRLASGGLDVRFRLPRRLGPHAVAFLDAGEQPHTQFMSRAWTISPLADLLTRLTP